MDFYDSTVDMLSNHLIIKIRIAPGSINHLHMRIFESNQTTHKPTMEKYARKIHQKHRHLVRSMYRMHLCNYNFGLVFQWETVNWNLNCSDQDLIQAKMWNWCNMVQMLTSRSDEIIGFDMEILVWLCYCWWIYCNTNWNHN